MRVTDPQPLLDKLDLDELAKYIQYNPIKDSPALLEKFHLQAERELETEYTETGGIVYHEPYGIDAEEAETSSESVGLQGTQDSSTSWGNSVSPPVQDTSVPKSDPNTAGIIEGKVLRLGDFIDTDAVSRPFSSTHLLCTHSLHLDSVGFPPQLTYISSEA
jgi:hypothetical protein